MKKQDFIMALRKAGLTGSRLQIYNEFVGFTFGKGVWHWFDVYPISQDVYFDHSYSQNNGVKMSGYRHKERVIGRLAKLGIDTTNIF